jgi:hypothetical protein
MLDELMEIENNKIREIVVRVTRVPLFVQKTREDSVPWAEKVEE